MKKQIAANRLAVVVAWVALLFFAILAAAPLVPLAPPSDLQPTDFSVSQAFDHIERIAQAPRPIGSLANQQVRADIVVQLENLGLEPEVQISEAPDYFGIPGQMVEIGNVVARIPGTAPTTAIALVGHYDTVPSSLGANDDASAVAILLESARAILSGPPLRQDVILVFIDGEEPAPRFGSSAFVAGHHWANDIGFVINLEAVGSGGPSNLIEINGPGRWVIDQYIDSVPFPVAFSFLTTTAELIGGSNSDFATFQKMGVAGIELAYLHGSPIYHTMADTPAAVSLHSLQQQGANTLAITRHLGNLEPGPSPDSAKAVFFNVGRSSVVRYPIGWVLPIIFAVGVLLFVAWWRQGAWLRILQSFGITVATMIASAVAAVLVWTLIAGQRSTMGIAESYLYLAGLILMTAGIVYAAARLARRQIGMGADAAGVLAVWWVFGLLTALAAPGMSYLFVWPSLAGGLALLCPASPAADHRLQFLFSVAILGTAMVLLVPAIDTFYQLAQPRPGNPDSQILSLIAIPILLLTLVVELYRVFWLRSERQPVPVRQTADLQE